MSPAALGKRLERMPMLKLLLPLTVGILAGEGFALPLWFLAASFAVAGTVALLWRSSAALFVMAAAAGWGSVELHEKEPAVPRDVATLYNLEITGIPAQREGYSSAQATVTAWLDPLTGAWYPARERIILRADTSVVLSGGERLVVRGYVRPFRGEGGGAGYRRLMERRGFAGTLYISRRTTLDARPLSGNDLHRGAAGRMARLDMEPDAAAVARAMVAGDRSAITAELRQSYARSGFSHLLAVSGLHTGIIFIMVNLLLRALPLVRRGHLVRNLLVAAAVWLFVAVAGFPASAVRAAVMCTFLQLASASSSEYVAMNGLAAAAVGMLLWQPAWIGDISFLLSFIAVAAILAWGVPLCRRCRTRHRLINAVIDGYIIGLVSTLATAPLVSHTFGIFSVAGLLLGPVAILLGTVVVTAGVVWLVVPWGFAAPVFELVVGTAARGINVLARLTADMPCGVADHRLSGAATWGVYALFAAITIAVWCRDEKKRVLL